MIHPDDIPRLAELEIVASLQPGHAPIGHIFPPGAVGHYLHPDQIEGAYAWQTIRETGAKVIFSTDWPVIPVNVMANVKAAIAPLDLGEGWADQTQSLHDTLASYTRDNAWAEFNENTKGTLAVGMTADVAVMSHDLLQLAPENITIANAVAAICDGKITFQRQK